MLTMINKQAFDTSDPRSRLVVHDFARMYGAVTLPVSGSNVVIAWRSTAVAPTIADDVSRQLVWIGVDERVACVSYDGQVQFALAMSSPLLQLEITDKVVIIVCESELVVVNANFTIRTIVQLGNVPEQVALTDNRIIVHMLGGDLQEVQI